MQPGARRVHFRQGLSKLYLPIYDALCQATPARWAPYYGFRTFDEQTALYARGRTSAPIGEKFEITDARAGESPHNYGCASDWILWDENDKPLWLEADDPRWAEYRDACNQVGARWGGTFSKVDRPHNEVLIHCDWKHILITYKQGGMTAAQEHIESNR